MSGARILVECTLAPVQGNRFQPTGFPDLGPAAYTLHDRTVSVLVDSPQSVTNHLEGHCLTSDGRGFVDALNGLSMVVAKRGDKYMTNSVLEGHRLASPYILGNKKKTDVGEVFAKLDKKGDDLADRSEYLRRILEYDINTLLHGAWFSRTGEGRIRIARAVSAFIEADNARESEYGGVKRDHVTTSVTPSDDDATGEAAREPTGDASTGMGSIPYHRVDYTAEKITAYFNVDVEQIRSYGFEDHERRLLETLALWKIRRFLDSPFRPRTACDLKVVPDSIQTSPASSLPAAAELEGRLADLISECRSSMGGDNGITTVQYTG